MPNVVNVFNQAEVLFQEEEYFDAVILECEEESGTEIMIQQNGNCVNLHVNSIPAFVKCMKSVAAKQKSIVAAKSAANKQRDAKK
jgi:hypothetical protein